MRDAKEPFWEVLYRDLDSASAFGSPSKEVSDYACALPAGASALDIGAGDGRNAIALLEVGLRLTALDISLAAVTKLVHATGVRGFEVRTYVEDIRHFQCEERFDLIVAHGVLHLMPRLDAISVIDWMQRHTSPGGYNIVAVFTDVLPAPSDQQDHVWPFPTGLLGGMYGGWEITRAEAYIRRDDHPGDIRHKHAIEKVVARNPAAVRA